MKFIVGLGNPGGAYAGNRHNLGFMCLSHFAKTHGIPLDKKQSNARTGTGEVAGVKILLARPQTYMNSSGESVSGLVRKFKLNLDDIFVIHDDLDLPLGRIRLRWGGSSAGHRGIQSIIACLGTKDFPRLRVGIGRPLLLPGERMTEDDVIHYVLSDFTSEEKQVVEQTLPRVSEAIVCFLTEGLDVAMNRYNR
ncbi:MAG: aminoacyl-tRNA hydrolase [Chloroflexi bacterium]|nr:aminoacyl-tRNA hydrolase [Chloroflexota bacterium]